jgi:hypothetical protein
MQERTYPPCSHNSFWSLINGQWLCPLCDAKVIYQIIGSPQLDDEAERARMERDIKARTSS